MSLPLWGKIAVPAVLVFLLFSALKLIKVAAGIAVLGGLAYVVITLFNRFSKGKE
ncbi:MAG: hypothetical protein AAFQ83_11425 [Bacteroidota bacterium]